MKSIRPFRCLWTIIVTCVVAWSSFSTPAFAANNQSVDNFFGGFWQSLGNVLGGAVGIVVTCYAVDAAIAPFAPPVAAYLAPMCPAIGAIGGTGTVIGVKALAHAH